LSRQNNPKAKGRGARAVDQLKIRKATKSDADEVVDLVVRLKRLNNEFDPLLEVVPDVRLRARKYALSSLDQPGVLLLVATNAGKVVGVVRGEVRERLFYTPASEGFISEMYILPEHRRRALGQELLDRASKELEKMGAELIVADLPTRNEIGVHFYTKRGFRRLMEIFARLPQ